MIKFYWHRWHYHSAWFLINSLMDKLGLHRFCHHLWTGIMIIMSAYKSTVWIQSVIHSYLSLKWMKWRSIWTFCFHSAFISLSKCCVVCVEGRFSCLCFLPDFNVTLQITFIVIHKVNPLLLSTFVFFQGQTKRCRNRLMEVQMEYNSVNLEYAHPKKERTLLPCGTLLWVLLANLLPWVSCWVCSSICRS